MHMIRPSKEVQEAAGRISVGIEALEYLRKDLWCLPYENRRTPEVLELIKAHHEHAHEDVLKWAEKEGKHISYDDAVEIVVFSGVIRPGKNQVLIAIVIQPSFLPESRILTEQSQVMDTPVIDRDCHRPPADDDSTGPGTRKRERGDSPPRKRQKAGRRPDGTHEMGTDTKLDPSILGQQPLVKIVRDVSNSTFQTGDIICLDEHDTLCVRKAYTAMVWIRYRVETTMAIEQ